MSPVYVCMLKLIIKITGARSLYFRFPVCGFFLYKKYKSFELVSGALKKGIIPLTPTLQERQDPLLFVVVFFYLSFCLLDNYVDFKNTKNLKSKKVEWLRFSTHRI